MYPIPFRLMEASNDGVAFNFLCTNPSTLDTSLLYLTATINSQHMKVMIDTGANRS